MSRPRRQLTEERRIWKRRGTPQTGRIEPASGHARPCTISEHSRVGARLELTDSDSIPDTFHLVFEDSDRRIRCKVRWRKADAIGVEFV